MLHPLHLWCRWIKVGKVIFTIYEITLWRIGKWLSGLLERKKVRRKDSARL